MTHARARVALAVLLAATPALAAAPAVPAWFNATANRGFLPGVADFYQHQYFTGDPADSWESTRPVAVDYPQYAEPSGYCAFTAVTDVMAVWEARGYKGVVRDGTLTPTAATWQAASKQTILDIRTAGGTLGASDYLKDKYAADQAPGGAKVWPTKLKYDQFSVNAATGVVTTAAGTTLKSGTDPISAFETYRRILINGSTPLLRIEKTAAATDPALWWSKFHYVAGAGIDTANGVIFFADPDSNKGSNGHAATYTPQTAVPATAADAGNGGWTFYYTDPSKRDAMATAVENIYKTHKIVDAKTGAAFDPLTAANYFYADDYTAPNFEGYKKGAGLPIVTKQKASDANIDARKFTAADNALPIATPNGNNDPANYFNYYGGLKLDTSAVDKAYKITQSNNNAGGGALDATGAYHDTRIARVDAVSIQAADPVAATSFSGNQTQMVLFGAAQLPIDHFELVGIGNPAIDDPSIDHKSYLSTDGQNWVGTYQTGLDAFGNPTSGFWDYILASSDGLDIGDQVSVLMDTNSPLSTWQVLFHTEAASSGVGGDWTVQTFGYADIIDGDQPADHDTGPDTSPAAVPDPALAPIALLLPALARRTRRQA